jgi:hypothetical protein
MSHYIFSPFAAVFNIKNAFLAATLIFIIDASAEESNPSNIFTLATGIALVDQEVFSKIVPETT